MTAGLERHDLLATAATAIHDLLGYPYVAIALSDSADPTSLVLRGVAGPFRHAAPVGYRLPLAAGITGAAARERRLQLVNDVTADPRYIAVAGATAIRAELAAPLLSGAALLGALNIESEHPIDDEDAAAILLVAEQLSIVIDNTRLFADTQRALDRTRLLYETSQRISRGHRRLPGRSRDARPLPLHDRPLRHRRRRAAGGGTIRGHWTPEAGTALRAQTIPYNRDSLDDVLDAGQTVAIADVHADPRVSAGLREIQAREPPRARAHPADGARPAHRPGAVELSRRPSLAGGRPAPV